MLRYEWLNNNVIGMRIRSLDAGDALLLCMAQRNGPIGGGSAAGVECSKFVAKLYLFMIENMVYILFQSLSPPWCELFSKSFNNSQINFKFRRFSHSFPNTTRRAENVS